MKRFALFVVALITVVVSGCAVFGTPQAPPDFGQAFETAVLAANVARIAGLVTDEDWARASRYVKAGNAALAEIRAAAAVGDDAALDTWLRALAAAVASLNEVTPGPSPAPIAH